MPVEAFWDNDEKTVIRYENVGRWTMEEFWTAYEKARAMIDSVDHQVHFVTVSMDELSQGHVPPNFLTNIRAMYRNAHPRAGRTIVVPKPKGVVGKVWDSLITKTLPQIRQRLDFADSLSEARDMLGDYSPIKNGDTIRRD